MTERVSLARRLLRWLPVAAAVVVLVQIFARGWKPALAEEARLDQAELEVEARRDELFSTRARLADDEARVVDPIWQERLRRSLLRAGEPLQLESLERRKSSPATSE